MSISGLHMAVMAGAVFALLRTAFAAFPALALRYPMKKWAAAAAAIAAFAYLLISGAASPTVRAFLMIAIMFLAVLADRPALAMRNVAIAALVILGLWPESVLDVGFQMSFAAVVSLVAVYEVVRERLETGERRGVVVRLAAFFGGIVLSTLVASLAVAPFAAYHFHKSQQFAILANLVAIPICNLVVMPAGLATLVAMPLGLEAVPLAIMAWGIAAMTWAAQTVAALPGAVGRIPAISDWAFSLMAAGGIWLALWRTRWRALGLGAAVCGLALAPARERPDMLVGHGGELVALRTADGALAALPGRRFGFDLKRWLEHDGDARSARDAARGDGFRVRRHGLHWRGEGRARRGRDASCRSRRRLQVCWDSHCDGNGGGRLQGAARRSRLEDGEARRHARALRRDLGRDPRRDGGRDPRRPPLGPACDKAPSFRPRGAEPGLHSVIPGEATPDFRIGLRRCRRPSGMTGRVLNSGG